MKPKFSLGRVLSTPGALAAIEAAGQSPSDFLDRHLVGDWGTVGEEDWGLNNEALTNGSRILSAYRTLRGKAIWIITEAENEQGRREATTLLLPEEY